MEFYGRKDILATLNTRADGLPSGYRQNIAVLGEALIGKTYLIQHWISAYCNNFVVPVYLEIKPEGINSFVEQFLGRFLFSFLKNSQIPLKDDMEFLIGHAHRYIPKTIAIIKELLSEKRAKRTDQIFTRLLNIPEAFYQETGKHCIIIFDEFHLLEELKIKEFYTQWRKQIMLANHTMYILLSSEKQRAERILSTDLDLLFGNFEKIHLEALENKAAQAFLQQKSAKIACQEPLRDFIISFTCAKPFYLSALTNALIDYHARNPQEPVSIDSLSRSLENTFIDDWGILNMIFSHFIEPLTRFNKDPIALKSLLGFASGLNRISELSQHIGKTKREFSQVLHELCGYEMLVRNADVYSLRDRTFGFWLRYVYALRKNNFSLEYDAQREIFRSGLKGLYQAFCNAQNKGISERLLELFNQFGNETIEVHNKRMRLHHFKEVKVLNLNGKRLKEGILARGQSGLWITGFKEDKVMEEDILDFIHICKRFKYAQAPKKIFIAFDEIEVNAHLIAKEEKIATWDVSVVNSLLDSYDKPRFVK